MGFGRGPRRSPGRCGSEATYASGEQEVPVGVRGGYLRIAAKKRTPASPGDTSKLVDGVDREESSAWGKVRRRRNNPVERGKNPRKESVLMKKGADWRQHAVGRAKKMLEWSCPNRDHYVKTNARVTE